MKQGVLCLVGVLLVSCSPPKYAHYRSPSGDFVCDVPWGWSVYQDQQGSDFSNLTFVGPFDPDFYRGLPSLSVRWHARNRPHRFKNGIEETYASAEDFIAKMLAEVYGPQAFLMAQESGKKQASVDVSGRQATHFVVVSAVPVPLGDRFGVSENASGKLANVRQHAYVVLPMNTGFYVLVYPATRQGYPKYLDRFNKLVNSFRVIKEGPASVPAG